jgi:hypothetical protein
MVSMTPVEIFAVFIGIGTSGWWFWHSATRGLREPEKVIPVEAADADKLSPPTPPEMPQLEARNADPQIVEALDEVDGERLPSERDDWRFWVFMNDRAKEMGGRYVGERIVGTTFDNADGSSRQELISKIQRFDELQILPEPENPYSRHALMVLNLSGEQLGYLPEGSFGVCNAFESGGTAKAWVRGVIKAADGGLVVPIGVAWYVKISPRNEFRRKMNAMRPHFAEEWFFGKLRGLKKVNTNGALRQAIIERLQPDERLLVQPIGDLASAVAVALLTRDGQTVAELARQQADVVLAGLRDGRLWGTVVFEVRTSTAVAGLEPVVALVLYAERFTAEMEATHPGRE